MYPPGTQKHKGSIAYWLVAALLVMSILSTSLATLAQATLSTGISSKIALQAQQYADACSEIIKATKYDELTAHERTIINNSIYQDEVIIGPETSYPGNEDIKQKVCTVNVYRLDEEYPRYSLNVIRTSVSLDNSVPVGSILPYNGNLDDIPENWALCDGKNGTPDLRDRFITGAGNSYDIGDFGGENFNVLSQSNLPVNGLKGFGYITVGRYATWQGLVGTDKDYDFYHFSSVDGSNSWKSYEYLKSFESVISNKWNSEPIENRPPYYALYYIMKIK